jgi:hypothetical protein
MLVDISSFPLRDFGEANVPKADILQCSRNWHYSITSSERESSICGTEAGHRRSSW